MVSGDSPCDWKITGVPRNAALGCISDNTLIEAYGQEVARELREIGAHVNLLRMRMLIPILKTRSSMSVRLVKIRNCG